MTADYSHDPAGFFDAFIKVNELGQPFMLMDHQREILPLAFDFDEDGRLPWDTIVYSCPKIGERPRSTAASPHGGRIPRSRPMNV